MSDLSGLVSSDSREPIERLRRARLWQIAEAYGIKYPAGAPKDTMIQLLKGSGVDVTRPIGDLQWTMQPQYDENGRQIGAVPQPVEPANGSERAKVAPEQRMAVMEAKEREREKQEASRFQEAQIEALRSENESLKRIIEERLQAIESFDKPPMELPYDTMTLTQLRLLCKNRGLIVKGNKETLQARLEMADRGEDPS